MEILKYKIPARLKVNDKDKRGVLSLSPIGLSLEFPDGSKIVRSWSWEDAYWKAGMDNVSVFLFIKKEMPYYKFYTDKSDEIKLYFDAIDIKSLNEVLVALKENAISERLEKQAKVETERKHREEQAKLEVERRLQEEHERLEEERRQQEEQARLEEEERRQNEIFRLQSEHERFYNSISLAVKHTCTSPIEEDNDYIYTNTHYYTLESLINDALLNNLRGTGSATAGSIERTLQLME